MPFPAEDSKGFAAPGELDLRRISTQWSQIPDTHFFVLRYSEAARVYLEKILGNEDDAADVLQSFLVRVLEKGFQKTSPDGGRFRHYLIRSIKNEAIDFLRRRNLRRSKEVIINTGTMQLAQSTSDEEWDRQWAKAIVDRAWKSFQLHEQGHPGNFGCTAIQLMLNHPEANSNELAEMLSAQLSRTMSPEAFRKQLSRARRLFASMLLQEVTETLEIDYPATLLDEMSELGLLKYVRDYLPKSVIPTVKLGSVCFLDRA